MKRFLRSNMLVLTVLAAVVIAVVIYPEVLLTFKTSFVLWSDYNVEYSPAFILTTFFYQGGIQLWNFFGVVPFFHTYATTGLFKFPNVVTAIVYYLMAPFAENSSALFQHIFAWAQITTLLVIRVIGIYLLLGTVTKNRSLLTAGAVIFAVFFSQSAFLMGAFFRSYFPLGIYFVIRFFQGLQARFLMATIGFLLVALGNELLRGGYLYLPFHFLFVAGTLWKIIFDPVAPRSIVARLKDWKWKCCLLGIVAVFIFAPYIYIIKFGFSDLAFGQADSRIGHPFYPQWYFHSLPLALGDPSTFFSSFLNINSLDTFYIGIGFVFLAMVGLVMGRNSIKWIFAMTIVFIWLLTFPKENFNIGSIAHWINALTNPLKTVPRSYFNSFQAIMPYLLMPLAVMGIESVQGLYQGRKFSGPALAVLGVLSVALLSNVSPHLPGAVNVYLTVCIICLWGALAWACYLPTPAARRFLAVTICFFVFTDILFIIDQSKRNLVANSSLKPVILDAAPQSGLVDIDFENPSIFPYRNTYLLQFSFKDEPYLWFQQGQSSALHHVINLGLNYTWLNGYNPRHVEFAKWLNDPEMLGYLKSNNEFIFLAPSAIKASPGALSRITEAGLARQVVEVDDPKGALDLPAQWPRGIKDHEDPFQYDHLEASLEVSPGDRIWSYQQEGDLIIFRWRLPLGFPAHLATSWFLPEQEYVRFLVQRPSGQWQELQAAQGSLIRPNTFDVQNIKPGELWAAFSKDDFPMHQRCVLLYPSHANQGVVGLWRKQNDNLGIFFKAKSDGWLVTHYPFDTKFKIKVDGNDVPFYRTNKSFIGFPLHQGDHKIMFQYWPHSPLRLLLFISALLTTLGLPGLIYLGLKWEEK